MCMISLSKSTHSANVGAGVDFQWLDIGSRNKEPGNSLFLASESENIVNRANLGVFRGVDSVV